MVSGTCALLVSLFQCHVLGLALPAGLSASHTKILKAKKCSDVGMGGGETFNTVPLIAHEKTILVTSRRGFANDFEIFYSIC